MWGLLAWAVLGLIAGAIAKAIYPGHQGGGILATMALGIIGSFIGGLIGNWIFGVGAVGSLSIAGIGFAVLGAILLIFLWGLVTQQSA
jgi:uncharacterized membrane protein YeaQ/YmgE (transglycosylase-associated protein family)